MTLEEVRALEARGSHLGGRGDPLTAGRDLNERLCGQSWGRDPEQGAARG